MKAFYLLHKGDKIENGDEFWDARTQAWIPCSVFGGPCDGWPHRRTVKPVESLQAIALHVSQKVPKDSFECWVRHWILEATTVIELMKGNK